MQGLCFGARCLTRPGVGRLVLRLKDERRAPLNVADDAAPAPHGRVWTGADTAEWRSGWRVALGAAAGMGTGISLYLYVSSIFIEPISRAFGWTRGDLAIGGMISFVVGAAALPLIGRLLDRFGFRRVALVCAPALAGIYLATALQPGAYWFYVMLMIIGGVFGGGTAGIVYMRPVIASFDRQRGLALGLATAGTAIAAMLAPPLLAWVIAGAGWRAGFFALAALTALIGLPLALMLIGRAREDVVAAVGEVGAAPAAADVSLREAMGGARFWLLALALVAINIPGAGVLGQLAPLISDRGLADSDVALVMSIYAAGLLAGRLITGFALDRTPAWQVGAATTAAPTIGILLLMAPSPSFALAGLAVGLIGVQQGAELDLFGFFVSRSFGLKHYGAIYGLILMAGALSTAVALILFGEMHDATGSYDIALWIGAACFGLGALAFAAIGRTRLPGAAAP
jgi:MFS family permease